MSDPGPRVTLPEAPAQSREYVLADLFVSLADTLVADFDVVELFDRLITTCRQLFDVSAAAVLIMDAHSRLRLMASSDERAEQLELFQIQVDEGPCLDSARSRSAVVVADLRDARSRWPRFYRAAEIVGFRAVHAMPLRLRSEGLGAMGLFHRSPTVMTERDLHTVQALADVATIGVLQQQHAQQAAILKDQLQGALDSRVAIEQAKGILAEAGRVDMDEAFRLLRSYCRDHNVKLSALAHAIAGREIAAATVIAAGQRRH